MTDKTKKNGLGWRMWTGIWASLLYAVAAILILIINLCYSPPSPPLGLNGIGDYLAGAFSPLAFLWLVIGYLMQNAEIKNQSKQFQHTLNLQEEKENKIKIENNNKIQPVFHITEVLEEGYGSILIEKYRKKIADESENIDEYHEKMSPNFFIHEIHREQKKFYYFEIKLEFKTLKNNIFNLSIEKEIFSPFQDKKIIIAPELNTNNPIKTALMLSLDNFEKLLSHQPITFNIEFEDESRNIQSTKLTLQLNIFFILKPTIDSTVIKNGN